jgi:hypothetical protein
VSKVWLLRGFLDRVLLIGAAIAGGLVPGFIAQYRQRLGGRLEQARLDLEPWQKLADQFHHGSLEQLIQYHLDSTDPKFHAEGAVIRTLADSVQHLQLAADALHQSLFRQVTYLALHTDPQLARATLTDWVPTFAFSLEGMLFALLFALGVWLVFHALWEVLAFGGRRALGARYGRVRRSGYYHSQTRPGK